MKKNIYLLLIFLATNFSFSKDVRIKVKSSFETKTKFKNESITSIKYIPIEGKITKTFADKSRLNFFFKLRGQRDDILKKDIIVLSKKDNINYGIDETISGLKQDSLEKFQDDIKWNENTYERIDKSLHLHYHGPHEHDNMDIDHEHDDDTPHEHEHDSDVLTLTSNRFSKPISKDRDFQLKLGLEYAPSKFTSFKAIYFPTVYDGDEYRYNNSFVFDINHTKLFKNDKISLTLNPKLTTKNGIIPQILDLRNHIRYSLNNDTTLGLKIVNLLQTDVLADYHNFRNSLELFYDYNTEFRRFHPYWEVLDHEHEKINQTKFTFNISHSGNYLINKNENKNLKYDRKVDILESSLGLKYKKTDFLTKGLIIKNDAKLNLSLGYITNVPKWSKTYEFYGPMKNGNVTLDELNKATFQEQKISYNKDLSEYLKTNLYTLSKKPYVVILKERGKALNLKEYPNSINVLKELIFTDNFNLKYKNFEMDNKLFLAKDFSNKSLSFNNLLKLSYKKKFNMVNITPSLSHEFDTYYKDTNKYYNYNLITLGIDNNILFNIVDARIKLGVDLKNEFQIRKATSYGTSEKSEIDKNIYGNIFTINPYIDIKWQINNNLLLKGLVKYEHILSKDATLGNNHQMYKLKDTSKIQNLSSKVSLTYEW